MIQGWFDGWLDCIVGRPMAMVLLAEPCNKASEIPRCTGACRDSHRTDSYTWQPSPSQLHHQHMSFIASTKCSGNISITPILFRCLSSPTSYSNAHYPRENLSPRQPPLNNGPLNGCSRGIRLAQNENNRDLIRDQHLACRLHRNLAMMGSGLMARDRSTPVRSLLS